MLFHALFGNQNIEKILFFLLINEKCYASQLYQCLGGALTPFQQALLRLEKGSIIKSRLEGKTRLYSFNPHYPFLHQLQALLKQGYHQLTLPDQQSYYCPEGKRRKQSEKPFKEVLLDASQHSEALPLLWKRLLGIKHLSFSAQSKADKPSGWNGIGKAQVDIKTTGSHSLLFQEQGKWISEEGKQFDFKNVFRWTWQTDKSLMTLEHLRYGPDRPVILFELGPISLNRFETVHPYLCRQDTYFAHLYCDRHFIQLNWRILGPQKNEDIHYLYT